jgi:hypothetical protein
MNYVLVSHIDDGNTTEGWELWTDQAALDEFWSPRVHATCASGEPACVLG